MMWKNPRAIGASMTEVATAVTESSLGYAGRMESRLHVREIAINCPHGLVTDCVENSTVGFCGQLHKRVHEYDVRVRGTLHQCLGSTINE